MFNLWIMVFFIQAVAGDRNTIYKRELVDEEHWQGLPGREVINTRTEVQCAVFANLKADLRNAIRFSAGVCEVGWLNSPPPQSTSSVIDVKVRMSLMIDGQAVSHECPVEYPYPYKDGKRCFETNLEEKFKAVTVGTKGFLTKKSTS
ncbi:uncharacterized protein LOC111707712 isoform X1 [Eurytemora carolleeae]|uniref:uncharacterized protein LOC111707712 isoform X1 n=1 Tax=Eurytemora carolleeae TaxID=1294199 RepID=UPI000C784557|nr:uncharacterized protein LOC111707712 isoform X1 [Eurytemora carolleeae]|eukprot:XP_023336619.1 uncharacterized protein LOC111707712 isoform X1 [Eurytemora affinis]